MTLSRPTPQQIVWAAANTKSVTAASGSNSDTVTFNAACGGAGLLLKADNNGTPAAGDTVDFYLLYSMGDPDGADVTDEFASDSAGVWIARLDTNDGTDPIIWPVPSIPVNAISYQLRAFNNAASNAITVSAVMQEILG